MVRYHYRNGVTFDKKKSRWFMVTVGIVVLVIAGYVGSLYLAPQLVTVPFTNLTADATDKKIKSSRPGQQGNRLFIPQINIDVAINIGGNQEQLHGGAWQRNPALGTPEKAGNVALSAYKFALDMTPQATRAKSPFYNLGKLKEGDELTLDYQDKRYVYKIDRVTSTEAGAQVEQQSNDYRLTLYATDMGGSAVAGPVISAVRISPAVEDSSQGASNN